ncbi:MULTISPECIES: PH domain-containing protein [unclassified Peribacillus]|uniref:PH domain-containing protein n=1 Tax=unclassified Peribacillus TaxID=2675266 RepID=UPI00191130E8|nr:MULTISPECIES: PH domain-containing protein [unclassified Peribacillus]MBK5444743.1 PH domain-containing protein [Peribacillus sp. TH24]MBK5460553.1 PH domain-containing protein [Peribacillus sp. TH27]MBK5482343.1 PH domain-containing protein [Peribacillus sp. TH16]MBK5498707.1 PH domain-containing protein [Peribacillus sp. TH14]WMX56183.1 PH domain-containing protein [Peribacillus sp. R9-11]
MYSMIQPPTKKISKESVKVWRMTETITNLVILAVLSILLYVDNYFAWKEWIGWTITGLIVLLFFHAIWSIFIEPILLQKYWRYDVSEEFIQTKQGAWKETHELIPMTKVQSVKLNQGPLLRKYNLYSISIGTMGASHDIPAISEKEAYELRDKIAHFAKIKEVD